MTAFARAEDGAVLTEICAAHQHAIPAESYTGLADEPARAVAVLQLQQRAQALASETAARQESEALLRLRDAALADLLARVPVALQQLDAAGTIRWANQAALDLVGDPRHRHLGRNVAALYVEADMVASIVRRLTRREAVQDQPATLRRHDGSLRHVRISSLVGDGPDTTYLITRDVTDELVATESTGRLAAIVDSSSDAIVGKMLDGTIVSWNPGAERLFGYGAKEMVGNSIARIVPPERRDELADILARLSRGERIANHETERVRGDGSRVEISVSISPIHDRSGKIIGVAKIARDITERRQLERRRQELLEVIAHDLRTPLTTVLGYAQLLQRRLGDDVALAAIASQAARIERLLADVLEMERLESGRQYLRRAPFDLAQLTRESARQAAFVAGVDGIRVEAPEQPVIGEWDADRVAQILSNLLDNAGKYAPGAAVVVRVSVSGDEARVAVQDFGPGIAAVHLPHLFDRFVQVKTGSGVGLGLYISRALAEAHGGRLWVESTPGAGSVFTLALPLAPAVLNPTADSGGGLAEQRPASPQAAAR
jgi:PAS domain S-box-containing protein